MNDLAADPALADKLAEMMNRLRRAQQDYDDTAPLTVDRPTPGEIDLLTLQRAASE